MTQRQIAPGDFAIIECPVAQLDNHKYLIREISTEGIYIAPDDKSDCSLLIHTLHGWQVYKYDQPHTVTFEAKPTTRKLKVEDLLEKDYYTIQYKCKVDSTLKSVWSDEKFWYHKVGCDYGLEIRAHKPPHETYLQQYHYLHNTSPLERGVYPRIDGLMLNLRMGYSLNLVSAKEALKRGDTKVVKWLKERGITVDDEDFFGEKHSEEECIVVSTPAQEEDCIVISTQDEAGVSTINGWIKDAFSESMSWVFGK